MSKNTYEGLVVAVERAFVKLAKKYNLPLEESANLFAKTIVEELKKLEEELKS